MSSQMQRKPRVNHHLGQTARYSTTILAVHKPIMLMARDMCGDQALSLYYVTIGECETNKRTLIKHCGCIHAITKDHNYMFTPFPGIFQLRYDGTGNGVNVLEIPVEYDYNHAMSIPNCCATCSE